MNTLREALQEYLDLRRGLGYKMHDAGLLLPKFVGFMEERCTEYISTRLALEWAQRPSVQPAEWARRRSPPMCSLRGAATAWTAATFIEPSTRCRAVRAYVQLARTRDRGCMTSGITPGPGLFRAQRQTTSQCRR
jgi:hypothetical protein